jgi:hypothetical protein
MNLHHYLARCVGWTKLTRTISGRGRRRGGRSYRPTLEALEGRVLPAAVTWINPAGGDWDTAANWSTGALPTAADDVHINTLGLTITHSLGNTDRVRSLVSKSAISISAGTLALASPSTLSSALALSGGTLTGAGALTIGGLFTWTGGTMSGTGPTVANGGISWSGNFTTETLDTRTLTLPAGATATWSGTNNLSLGDGAVFNNQGAFTIQNDQTLFTFGASPAINNSGILTKATGTHTTAINAIFNSSGTVSISGGDLFLQGGGNDSSGKFAVPVGATLGFSGGVTRLASSVSGAGVVDFFGGVTDVVGAYDVTGGTGVESGTANFTGALISVGSTVIVTQGGTANFSQGFSTQTLDVDGGTLTGSAAITVTGTCFWINGGKLAGTGATTVADGATLTISGSNTTEILDTRGLTVDTEATATWSGTNNLSLGDGAQFENLGTFTIQNDQTIFAFGASPTIGNEGTLTKAATIKTTTVNATFDNTGTVNINSGDLFLVGGGTDILGMFNVPTGATLAFGGFTRQLSTVSGAGVVDFLGGVTDVVGTYDITGGTAVQNGTANFTGPLTSVGSTVIVTQGGTANFSRGFSTGTLDVDGGTLTGSAAVTVTGTFFWINGGTLAGTGSTDVAAGATLSISGTNTTETLDNRTLTIDPQAIGTWSGTNNLSLVDRGAFSNLGTFTIQNDQTIFSGAGGIINNGGTVTKSAVTKITTINARFNNTGTVNANSGALYLLGGGNDTGSFNVTTQSTLGFGGSLTRLASTVSGPGTVTFPAGVTDVVGTYNVTGGTTVDGGTANFTGTLTNAGSTVVVTQGGTANFSQNFRTGTLEVVNGGTLTGSGTASVTHSLMWSGGTLSGNGATFVISGATMTISGMSTTETLDKRTLTLVFGATATWNGTNNLSFGDGAVFNNQGSFTVQNNQTINVFGATPTINNSGTITKVPGTSTTTINATFNNTGIVTATFGVLDLLGGGNDSSGTFFVAQDATLGFGGSFTLLASRVSDAGTAVFNSGVTDVVGNYSAFLTVVGGIGGTANFSHSFVGSQVKVLDNGTANFSVSFSIPALTLEAGGTLTGSGAVTVTGSLVWSGGTLSGTGSTTVASGAQMSIGGTCTLDARTLTLAGGATAIWSGTNNLSFGDGAAFDNQGTFTIQNDQTISTFGASPIIHNSGTLTKIGGTNTTTINAVFNNSGSVNVNSGELSLQGGGNDGSGTLSVPAGALLAFGGGFTHLASAVSGAGEVNFSGGVTDVVGTYNVTGSTNVPGGTANFTGTLTSVGSGIGVSQNGTANFSRDVKTDSLTVEGGTLTGTGAVTVTRALLWNGGTMSGTGATVVESTGVMDILGTSTETLDRRTLTLSGAHGMWFGSDDLSFGDGAIFDNGGSFSILNDQSISTFGASPVILNTGLFTKLSSTGTTTINAPFINTGTVKINSGQLSLQGGSHDFSGSFSVSVGATLAFNSFTRLASAVSGAGNVLFAGGATDVVGNYDVTGATEVQGGTANFTGVLTSVGPLVQVTQGGTANFSQGFSTKTLDVDGGTLTGSGSVTVTGALLWINGGTLSGTGSTTVAAGATMSISGTSGSENLDSRTLTLSLGATASWSGTNDLAFGDGAVFNNQGKFTIQNDQSISTFGSTPALNNSGSLTKAAGTNQTSINVPVNNSGSVSANSGTLALLGGGNSSSGTFSVFAGASLSFAGIGVLGSISGAGTVNFSGGASDVAGTYNIGGPTTIGSNAAVNFLKTAGSGAFNTAGTVTISAGVTLTVNGDYTQSGGTTNLDGTTLAAHNVLVSSGIFSGLGTIQGNVSNAGTLIVGGTGTTGLLSISGNYEQTSAGTLDMEIGGNTAGIQFDKLAISGSATLAGTLNVSFINSFAPSSGSWQILTFANHTGTFTITNVGNGKSAHYNATNVAIF